MILAPVAFAAAALLAKRAAAEFDLPDLAPAPGPALADELPELAPAPGPAAMATAVDGDRNLYMERIPPGYIAEYTELYPCEALDDDNGTMIDRCAEADESGGAYGATTLNGQRFASTKNRMWFTETLIRVDTAVAWAPNVTTTTVEDYTLNTTITYQTDADGTVMGCVVDPDSLGVNTASRWWRLQALAAPVPGAPGETATVMRGTEYAGEDAGIITLVGYYQEGEMPDGSVRPFPRRMEMYSNGTAELLSISDYTAFTPVTPDPDNEVYVLPAECYLTTDESALTLDNYVGESPFPTVEAPDIPETSIEAETEVDDEVTTRLKFGGKVAADAKWVGDMSLPDDPAATPAAARKLLQSRSPPPPRGGDGSPINRVGGEPVDGRPGVRRLDDGTLCEEDTARDERVAKRKKANDALIGENGRPVGGKFEPGTLEKLEDDAERDTFELCPIEALPELECGVIFKSVKIRGVADVLIQYDFLTRVCAVSVEAAFSKAGIELSGALEVVAEPHFEAPEQVDFDGCVRLTVGCPSKVCKRAVVRNRLSIELASVCVRSGAEGVACTNCSVEGQPVPCPSSHRFMQLDARIGPSFNVGPLSGKAQLFLDYRYFPYFPCEGRTAAHRVKAGAEAKFCIKIFRSRKCPVDFKKNFVDEFAALG